ncbi:MAG: putative sporulation-specific glycosylase YdhD [Pelotomaculum sp. PtaB.Bin104]|nr:MAG: putative sporulation-specific glycosylase YdhD [Pelotomaculum sp. PtaB.Bin104]
MIKQRYPFENNWYYVTESRAIADLINNGQNINTLIPFWFGVNKQGGLVDQSDSETLSITRQFGLPIIPIVHNFASRKYGQLIHRLLSNQYLRQSLITNIYNMLSGYGFSGVNIDFEFVPPEDRQFLNAFMNELYQVLKPSGFLVTISLPPELRDDPTHPFSGAFSYHDLAQNSDQLYVLAYDEHVAQPGPIASIGFTRQVLSYALSVIPREKIRLGMAVYGRDWSQNTNLPMELSYDEAVNRAARFGAKILYDPEAQAPTYTYTENGIKHVVWFEDVRSFMKKINLVVQERIQGIGVWRFGLEDSRIWNSIRVDKK